MPRRSSDGYVYFIQAQEGLVKVGFSVDPEQRLASLQTGSPVHLRLVGYTPGGQRKEREIHGQLAAHRAHHEWFHPHPDVWEFMETRVSHEAVEPEPASEDRLSDQEYESKMESLRAERSSLRHRTEHLKRLEDRAVDRRITSAPETIGQINSVVLLYCDGRGVGRPHHRTEESLYARGWVDHRGDLTLTARVAVEFGFALAHTAIQFDSTRCGLSERAARAVWSAEGGGGLNGWSPAPEILDLIDEHRAAKDAETRAAMDELSKSLSNSPRTTWKGLQ